MTEQHHTFDEFYDKLSNETRYTFDKILELYNSFMGEDLTPYEFLSLPEVEEKFNIELIQSAVLMITVFSKKH